MTGPIIHPDGYRFTVQDHQIIGGPFDGMNCRAAGCDCVTKAPVRCKECGHAHAVEPDPCWQQAKRLASLEWFRRGYASKCSSNPDGTFRHEWVKGDEVCLVP